jgi:hypothetical protein
MQQYALNKPYIYLTLSIYFVITLQHISQTERLDQSVPVPPVAITEINTSLFRHKFVEILRMIKSGIVGRFNEDVTALTYSVRLLRMGNVGTGATAGHCFSEGSEEIVDCCDKFFISIH